MTTFSKISPAIAEIAVLENHKLREENRLLKEKIQHLIDVFIGNYTFPDGQSWYQSKLPPEAPSA